MRDGACQLIGFLRAGVEETGADKTKGERAMAGKKEGKEKRVFFNFPAWPVKKSFERNYPSTKQRKTSADGSQADISRAKRSKKKTLCVD